MPPDLRSRGHKNNKDSIAHKKYHTSESESHDPGNKF